MANSANAIQIFLSEGAYIGLIGQARDLGIIRTSGRARGIGLYVHDLVMCNPSPDDWVDNRPLVLQEATLEDLEAGQFPVWDDGAARFVRVFSVEDRDDISQLVALIATYHGIVKSRGRGVGVQRRFSTSTLNSQFWEAVGLGWLKPLKQPKSHYEFPSRRSTNFELDW